MSNDNERALTTVGYYQMLIDWSVECFGGPFEILEAKARARVEHAFTRNLGGFALALNPLRTSAGSKFRFRTSPYLYQCERKAMLEDKHGTLYVLISLDEGELSVSRDSGPEEACTHAVCVFPGSGGAGRLYLLYRYPQK